MKSSNEKKSLRKIIVAGAGVSALLIVCAGCASDKVLAERAYIPAPSNQVYDGTALPTVTPLPTLELPPFPEYKTEAISYTVKKGDSFWKIARMYGVSMQELAAVNDMDLKKSLKVGTVLKIPAGGAMIPEDKLPPLLKKSPKVAGEAKSATSAELPADGIYVVKNGDSLWKVARKFNTSINAIANANGIDPKTPLQVGQKLNISGKSAPSVGTETITETITTTETFSTVPGDKTGSSGKVGTDILLEEDIKYAEEMVPPAGKTPAANVSSSMEVEAITHDAREGDTWEKISNLYGVSVEIIKKANLKIAGEPTTGDKVIVPIE
jgi:LysM repeat protein